jgi:outer membrane protease
MRCTFRPGRTALTKAAAVLASSAFAVTALAQQLPLLPGSVSEVSIGLLNGKAQEFVYNPNGSTLSRLDWTMDNVAMLNAATSVRLLPWLFLGVKGSINIDGKGTLDDYDFDTGFCPPSTPGHDECHSRGPTKLRRAALLDIVAGAEFFRGGGVTAAALAGYKSDEYRWQAFGGTANYGILPPGLGISFEQHWTAPYLGLAVGFTTGAFSINGRVIGSPWANGDDRDDHHFRSLLFFDDFGTTKMVSADVGLAYRVNPYLSLTADYRYLNWGLGKGPTTIHDLTGGPTVVIPGEASGGNNISHTVSLGVKVDLLPQPLVQDGLKDEPAISPAVWTGWAFGVTSGFEWQRDKWTTTGLLLPPGPPVVSSASANFDDDGQRAGLFLGYGWRTGSFVWGVEADVGKSNTNGTRIGIPGTASAALLAASPDATVVSAGYDGSVRLRAGVLVVPTLQLYGTGGLAYERIEASASCAASAGSPWCVADRHQEISKFAVGWTAGVGYEWALAGNWFTRGEYRYTSLEDVKATFFANAPIDAVTAKIEPSDHRLEFGLGYRF